MTGGTAWARDGWISIFTILQFILVLKPGECTDSDLIAANSAKRGASAHVDRCCWQRVFADESAHCTAGDGVYPTRLRQFDERETGCGVACCNGQPRSEGSQRQLRRQTWSQSCARSQRESTPPHAHRTLFSMHGQPTASFRLRHSRHCSNTTCSQATRSGSPWHRLLVAPMTRNRATDAVRLWQPSAAQATRQRQIERQ